MRSLQALLAAVAVAATTRADVGDPQVKTDHPWYPGELASSTFDRLFATQAAVYERVTGKKVATDEDKVLAAWLWRNTHYAHGEEGVEDLWGKGFANGTNDKTRDYWTGLYANGFALCGTTHAQWVGEMEALLGHGRGRTVGVSGHNSFEAFLTGGVYGQGKWVLLDHDVSAVVFSPDGKQMLGLGDVQKDWKKLTDRNFQPARQRGWLICGLHPKDNGVYSEYRVAEYLSGYAGPPPMVHLRRGETFRRYLSPGLEDGATFAYWGRNYNTKGVPGPERSQTWVNQPEKMFNSKTGTPFTPGQARFGNAVFAYTPDFLSGEYKEAVVAEDAGKLTFEFSSPYIIAATPASNDDPWGVYAPGCRNGLVLKGKADCTVEVSVDRGGTWEACGKLADGLDLTDKVKGRRQYQLRLGTTADKLAGSGFGTVTVCQANPSVMPRLVDGGTRVTFEAGGKAVVSAGPTVPQAARHVVEGKIDSPAVTLEMATPRGEAVRAVYAAAHMATSSPPDPKVTYQIELSTDGGKTWKPVVKDWRVVRQGDEPKDFWSQSFCWGSVGVAENDVKSVRVRFKNSGGKRYLRPEVHAVYETKADATKVTFGWTDDKGAQKHTHTVVVGKSEAWVVPTGKGAATQWVEMKAVK